MQDFSRDLKTLNYVIKQSDNILLFAHTHPDGDTAGSVLALKEYAKTLGKNADIACFESFPKFITPIISETFLHPDELNLEKYQLVIACDSVERGFEKIQPKLLENQVVAILDHHQNISLQGDINIADPEFSSVCEIIYDFFAVNKIEISKKTATCLLLGILFDTGTFQHACTSPKVLNIASELVKKGAPLSKINSTIFSNKSLPTMKLWGRALERARINQANGLIASYLTRKDMEECGADSDDIAYISTILNTVPGTRFALILSEREDGKLKGSLRSEEYKNVDVSEIAREFGGDGHKLASGFEIEGKILETADGWEIV
jgi:phosphoesterase RecJ-like protein